MCGINGLIQFHKIYGKSDLEHMVHKMNACMIHRGPDSEGIFSDDICALGMRRLSVIDLPGGTQPVWNESKDKMIVFNGELYNYKSLRKLLQQRGHMFTTRSDTEVVLHGLEDYGTDFLEQMEGMFAFAFYDLCAKKWILARDRIGEKPLYYYHSDRLFLFASELKSILCTGCVPKEIDRQALTTYFQLTYIPAPASVIRNVRKLMPGTAMILDAQGKEDVITYWDLKTDIAGQPYDDYDQCKILLRKALFESVERRMCSDVPVGAFLSGGFDSAVITGIMSQIADKPVDTFTIGFREKKYDESSLAGMIAKKNKTNHHVLILDWDRVFLDLEKILNNMDEPFGDSSLLATYAVSKMAKQYVTVVLTGDAGDELFAGYDKYLIRYYGNLYQHIPKILKKGLIEPVVKLLPSRSSLARKADKVIQLDDADLFQKRRWLMSLGFKEQELKSLMSDGAADPMDFIRYEYEYLKGADEQLRAQYMDLRIVLEGDMLAKVDRASMLASLETRIPMLDRHVIGLAFRMPARFKINRTERKIILKDTFRDLLPEEIFHASKHGFGVPTETWLETSLKKQLYEYASPDFLQEQGLFSWQYINHMIEAHMAHRENRSSELWTFFVFQSWYQRVMSS